MNIVSHFLENAEKLPHQVAISGETDITYAQLKTKVIARAAYLQQKGIGKGDRVLVFVPMSVALYVNVLALFYIGATVVFIDEWVSKKRLELCCKLAQCKAFIAPRKLHLVAIFFKEIRKIPVWLSSTNYIEGKNVAPRAMDASDAALITFTTGSTGIPKAAIRTHGILQAQFNALRQKTELTEKDRIMTTLPIVLLIGLGRGSTMVMARFKPAKPWKMNPKRISVQIQTHKINVLIASPFFIERLCEVNQKQTTIQKLFTGGAPVFPILAKKIKQIFPDTNSYVVFGSTEAEPISMTSVDEIIRNEQVLLSKGLFAGKVDPHAEVAIISVTPERIGTITEQTWKEMVLPINSVGEIVVSGTHVVRKYWANEQAFAENKIVVNGKLWHRTGDAGRLDENGNVWLWGRCKQLIEEEGVQISPFIYEAQLASVPGVVIGTVRKIQERIVLVIESLPRASHSSVEAFISGLGIRFDEIKFISSMPRDPRHFSKIDHQKLAGMI